jgi:sugar/nucleoside kinase (ribokinase family)
LLAGGNFILDHVKVVDHYPEENMLAVIRRESICNGGGAYNVLKNLAALGAKFPLEAAGFIGDDLNGSQVMRDCEKHGINVAQLHRTPLAATAYTDVITAEHSGRRTFFYQPGANALLDAPRFNFQSTNARLFHLGYLMLLPQLDALDGDGRTGSSRVLEAAQAAGLITSADIVSIKHPDFGSAVRKSLPFIDHLIINEVEAGMIIGRSLNCRDLNSLCASAKEIFEMGVRQAVVIHFEEGVVALAKEAVPITLGSLSLPPGFNKGAAGAGDAFAAGYLYGLHNDWSMINRLELAVCAAAACLSDPTPSNGLRSVQACLDLGSRHGFRSLF